MHIRLPNACFNFCQLTVSYLYQSERVRVLKMDPKDCTYLHRGSSFSSLEALRSVIGIVLGLFLVLWIRDPIDETDKSDETRKTRSLLAVLAAFVALYFIFDFYLSRSMSLSLRKSGDMPEYPAYFRICVIIQFLLLACVILVGGNLVWNSSQSPVLSRESMIKKIIVVFLSLYVYKLCSLFYAYYLMLNSYEYFRAIQRTQPGDNNPLTETRTKLQIV